MRTHLATLALLAAALPAWAGSLDAPAAPASGSGMPSTTDIYNRLDTGATVSVPGTFQEPAAGPTAGTGRTLADIAAKLPVPDNTQGAAAGDVANGKTFWGLRTDGTWGVTSGAAAAGSNVTGANGLLTFSIPDGFYTSGKTASAVDSNLQPGNIKSGVTIFGVTGTASQASGTAAAGDVLTGKTFSNSSATGINGSMTDNGAVSITPGTAAQTIPAGYHNGAGSVAGDANLASGNIKSGVTIFGVTGTASQASGTAVAGDVLTGKTFSNGSATGINGNMADNGAVSITPGTATQTIPAGYHNGAGSVAGDANLVSGNIKSGASIFGVSGSSNVVDTTEAAAAATAADIRLGKKAYVNGVLVTGTYCPNGWSGANCDIISMPFGGGTLPALTSNTPPWKCVHHTTTGLTWEVKTVDWTLHDIQRLHSWYDSSAPTPGTPGTPDNASCASGTDANACDTEKFVAAVNAEQLCGYTDWRMPSPSELANVGGGGINLTNYFGVGESPFYWTNATYAADPTRAIYGNLGSSSTNNAPKYERGRAILVRP